MIHLGNLTCEVFKASFQHLVAERSRLREGSSHGGRYSFLKKLFRVPKKNIYVVFACDPAFSGGRETSRRRIQRLFVVRTMQRYFF